MLVEYIEEALKRAHYEIIADTEPYYGQIKELPGVWATGDTLENCRMNLKEDLVSLNWCTLAISYAWTQQTAEKDQ